MNDLTLSALTTTLERMGLAGHGPVAFERLSGGVSSDIVKVTAGVRVFALKRALPKLKVAAEWYAPVERNAFEVAWLRQVAQILPAAVPEVLAHDSESGSFAMTYLDPDEHPVWKNELLDGRVDPQFAAQVGRSIAAVHNATSGDPAVAARFSTDHIFHPIRLEPYLEATARRHPAAADELMTLSRRTLARKEALVHGDVSPKNILAGPGGPLFLDAECAWYGDPAFDVAFCLNHLLLKCLRTPAAANVLLTSFDALAAAYFGSLPGRTAGRTEKRAARLLPALFLARVDGKSPVEYITAESERDMVRRTALPLLAKPMDRVAAIRDAWADRMSLG